MNHKGIVIMVALVVLAVGGTAAFYRRTVHQINASKHTKSDKLEQLVKASKSRVTTFSLSKNKPSAEVEKSKKWCNEAVAGWADFAGRCANTRDAIRDVAEQVRDCNNNQRAYDSRKVKRCLSFLEKGGCDLLDYERKEMALSLPEVVLLTAKGGKDQASKPQPQIDCIGAF